MSMRSRIRSLPAVLALAMLAGIVVATPVPGSASAALAPGASAPARAPDRPAAAAAPAPTPRHVATPARTPRRRPAVASAMGTAASPSPDSAMTLKGGQEGTAFRTLTVEGEDRIRMDYERPVLDLDLDPEQAAGLDPGSARDVLSRTTPDAALPLLTLTGREPSPFLARPWLGRIASGAVARFRPNVKGVESWTLVIADSRGGQVARFEGSGDPPGEITWDGRMRDGGSARPGLTYSYVFAARDRAGNRRNFVGEGFQIPAYRLESARGLVMMIPGEDLGSPLARPTLAASAPALVTLEAASWLNRLASPAARIQVTVVARSQDRANALAAGMVRDLSRLVLGDPGRVAGTGLVEPDAPEAGTVRIEAGR